MFDATRLKKARESKDTSLSRLSELTGISKSTLQRYETGTTSKVPMEAVALIERALNLKTGYLMGWEEEDDRFPSPAVTEDYTTFPVIGEIAAGYDRVADETWTGEKVDIPNSYLKGRKPSEFFVLLVKGESMFPTYQDGDRVLILKQETLNYSGQIGAIIYGDDCATLKRVEFVQGEDWLRLVPVNPSFPPIRIEDNELESCRVLGIPKLVIREIN